MVSIAFCSRASVPARVVQLFCQPCCMDFVELTRLSISFEQSFTDFAVPSMELVIA